MNRLMARSGARGAGSGYDERATRRRERLELLLEVEGRLRDLPSAEDVRFFVVNETRALLDYSQAFFMSLDVRGRARMETASGLGAVDGNAPLVRAIESVAERMARDFAKRQNEEGRPAHVRWHPDAAAEECDHDGELRTWPFPQFLWLPLRDRDGRPFSGLLLARKAEWSDADALIGERLAAAVAHALMALEPPSLLRRFAPPKWLLVAAPLALVALMLVPVPMTAVAPVEVVADDPFIVAAPMDGVIAKISKNPDTPVRAGETLFVYDDTRLKAEADVAARREAVARARLEAVRKAAFGDPAARRKLAEAAAELALARAEREHAERLLGMVRVRAERDGVVVYSDPSDWIRRPVRTGEKIMEIADPDRVALRISLPVKDAVAVRPGSRVRVFLDADPLRVLTGRVRTVAFHAEEMAGGLLAYRVMADLDGGGRTRVRIGYRGSAQVFGETVPLGFYLFRRPVAAFRQYFGI